MATIPGSVSEVRWKTPFPERRSAKADRLSPVAALVRRHDRDRFQTALFAPADRREALFALYAFNYEIARVRESVTQPMLGQIRLQWWREVVDRAYSAAPPRQHEVALALAALIRALPFHASAGRSYIPANLVVADIATAAAAHLLTARRHIGATPRV